MIEAAMIWNEPNKKSHWDLELDPDWKLFAEMAIGAGEAIAAEDSHLTRVLGGISPIDPTFLENLRGRGVLDHVDAVAVHGFPLDWNLWRIEDWPLKIEEVRAVTRQPIWVSEVGVSSFGSDEVQSWGLERTAELLRGRAPRIHWYSLYDLPMSWGATTRHKEAEGSLPRRPAILRTFAVEWSDAIDDERVRKRPRLGLGALASFPFCAFCSAPLARRPRLRRRNALWSCRGRRRAARSGPSREYVERE